MRQPHHPEPDPVGIGQESVWDYPRPPALVASDEHVVVRLGEVVVADTRRSQRVLETSHPPTYYLPPHDVDQELLRPAAGSTFCEWKGSARYYDVVTSQLTVEQAVWDYPSPSASFAALRDHVSMYPADFDCTVDGERVLPQEGGFYGGWITSRVVGPFKGGPGSRGW